jgi:hypothetical protein
MSFDDMPWSDGAEALFPLAELDRVLPGEELDRLLLGEAPARGASYEAVAVAELVRALRAPARPGELSAEAESVAAFIVEASQHRPCAERRRRRTLRGYQTAVAAAAASLAMGGLVAAAQNGSLPGPLQDVAHVVFGSPPPDSHHGNDEARGLGTPPIDNTTPTPDSRQAVGASGTDGGLLPSAKAGLCAAFVNGGTMDIAAAVSLGMAVTTAGQTVEAFCQDGVLAEIDQTAPVEGSAGQQPSNDSRTQPGNGSEPEQPTPEQPTGGPPDAAKPGPAPAGEYQLGGPPEQPDSEPGSRHRPDAPPPPDTRPEPKAPPDVASTPQADPKPAPEHAPPPQTDPGSEAEHQGQPLQQAPDDPGPRNPPGGRTAADEPQTRGHASGG